jgi:hypothetical protein
MANRVSPFFNDVVFDFGLGWRRLKLVDLNLRNAMYVAGHDHRFLHGLCAGRLPGDRNHAVVEFDLQPLNSGILLLDVLLECFRLLVEVEQLAADLFHKIKQSHGALLVVSFTGCRCTRTFCSEALVEAGWPKAK